MKYAQKFELKCYDALKTYFKSRTEEYTGDQFHIFDIPNVSQEIVDMFASEMKERGLPLNIGWLMFKKRDWSPSSHPNFTHIDIDETDDFYKVSIVIPIEGYQDTYMYWCEGEYHVDPQTIGIVKYYVPIWKPGTKIDTHRELIDSPTICRVDIPHSAVSSTDGSYRVVVTTRFLGNPSFEEVCEKLGN